MLTVARLSQFLILLQSCQLFKGDNSYSLNVRQPFYSKKVPVR